MFTACNSDGSISKGPSKELRMLQKESTGGARKCLDGEMLSDLRKWSAVHYRSVWLSSNFPFTSLLLSEKTHQVREKQRQCGRSCKSGDVNAVKCLK